MTLRCKFQLIERTEMHGGAVRLKYQARYDETIPEDQRFAKATPNGQLEMTVSADNAAATLKVGDSFYIDIAPVPVDPPADAQAEPQSES